MTLLGQKPAMSAMTEMVSLKLMVLLMTSGHPLKDAARTKTHFYFLIQDPCCSPHLFFYGHFNKSHNVKD